MAHLSKTRRQTDNSVAPASITLQSSLTQRHPTKHFTTLEKQNPFPNFIKFIGRNILERYDCEKWSVGT